MKEIFKRAGAILLVVLLLACVILTLVFAVTGSKNFLGMLMITLLLPILLWVYSFFYKLLKDRANET